MTLKTKAPADNAMALRYALKSGYPGLKAEASRIITNAFRDSGDNVTHAAKRLRVTRNTMSRLLQEVGI